MNKVYMKEVLELKSGLKIRRGFDKFINRTLELFNIVDIQLITKEDSEKVVSFINSSNSKLSESYWILRTKLNKEEYEREFSLCKSRFVESSYKHSNRRVVSSIINKKYYGRGYSGYVDIEGERYWCRSRGEFIYLKYLHIVFPKKEGFIIKTEELIFHYKGISYKPDIFIYKQNNLIKVFEIKSGALLKEELEKYELFKEYFDSLNLEFDLLNSPEVILKRYPEIKKDTKIWIEEIAKISFDVRGSKNPHYGCRATEETKRKIGLKTKERCSSSEYRKKLSDSIRSSITEESRMKASERQKKIQLEKQIERDKIDPIESRRCIICNSSFSCRSSVKRITCSSSCTYKYGRKIGIIKKPVFTIDSRRKTLLSILIPHIDNIVFSNFISFQDSISSLKNQNKISFNLGLSLKTINKYFDNFDNFKKIIEDESIKYNKK